MADIYGAITESAINRAIHHLMTWRPSLFNYVAPSQHATFNENGIFAGFDERWLVCRPVIWPAEVDHNTFPRYTRQEPLKIPSVIGGCGIPWCAQITDARIDLHPSNVIVLPSELSPPLDGQQFAVWVNVSGGIGCPPDSLIDALLDAQFYAHSKFVITQDLLTQMTFDVMSLICFSLEVFVTGHLYIQTQPETTKPPVTQIRVAVDGVEVKNVLPSELEDAIECYVRTAIRARMLPKMVLALEPIVIKALGLTMTINPTLTPGLPHNPAVEQNELRISLDVDIK